MRTRKTKSKSNLDAQEAGSWWTCSVCGDPHKLSRAKKLVLHGYRRPGYGFIVGNCFGVGYPPWESSPEGAEAWLKYLLGSREGAKKALTEAKNTTSVSMWVTSDWQLAEEINLLANGTFKKIGTTKDFRGIKCHDKSVLERNRKILFKEEKANLIRIRESAIEFIENDISIFRAKIAGWKAGGTQ